MPTKKAGVESMSMNKPSVAASDFEPRRQPERNPARVPMTTASAADNPTRSRVHGSRSAIRLATGCP